MTLEEYKRLETETKVYYFSIIKKDKSISYNMLNAKIESEIIYKTFKNNPQSYSFYSDTTHIGISLDNYEQFFLSKKEALLHKIKFIIKYYNASDKITQKNIKRFINRKNINHVVIKHFPEILI
jgi:hypothetical protein